MEATNSILLSHHTSLPSLSLSLTSKLPFSPKQYSPLSSAQLRISNYTLQLPLIFPLYPSTSSSSSSTKQTFILCTSAAEEGVALREIPKEIQRRKLCVVNLPFSLTVDDLKTSFGECGTVKEVEIIRSKDGKNRGFAFITMSSGDEAQAVVDKFNSQELAGRTIRVEFAKRLKRPRPQPSAVLPVQETRHKLYVSNLQWKTRSSHLREFFSAANFNPVSARVVFETANARSAGYGFVSFSTREEAESAISSLNEKELLGRPVRLKFSEKTGEGDAAKEEKPKENQDNSDSALGEEEVSNTEKEKS